MLDVQIFVFVNVPIPKTISLGSSMGYFAIWSSAMTSKGYIFYACTFTSCVHTLHHVLCTVQLIGIQRFVHTCAV